MEPDRDRLERRIDMLERELAGLEARLSRVERSVIFRMLRKVGGLVQAGRRGGRSGPVQDWGETYARWLRVDEERLLGRAAHWTYRPRISVLVYGSGDGVRASVDSVRAQTYPDWELIHANDWPLVCEGEWVCLLGAGDRLTPTALAAVVDRLQDSRPGVLYGDGCEMTPEGKVRRPWLQPSWSPTLLESGLYPGPTLVFERSLLASLGGLDHALDAGLESGLLLRASAREGCEVGYVPAFLSEFGYRVQPCEAPTVEIADSPLVSVIVCSRRAKLLHACLTALSRRTRYERRECIVVEHRTAGSEGVAEVAERAGARVIPYEGPFDFAMMNNLAARQAQGSVLLFLNDDVLPLQQDWLDQIVERLGRPGVGVVGALLLYPSGLVQHAGIALGIGELTGHVGRNLTGSELWPWLVRSREVSAVTGACLAVRRSVFTELGGFDEAFPVNYNDTDLCLRAWESGWRVVLETGARLEHRESTSRAPGTTLAERMRFRERWQERIAAGDPFLHRLLSDEQLEHQG